MSESQENNNESLIKVAKDSNAADRRYYDANGIPLMIDARGELKVMKELHSMMVAGEDNPDRRKGASSHSELDSFIAHINRMKEERTTIWADVDRLLFTAIYNDDPAGGKPDEAGWGDHRALYACPVSPEWVAWTYQQNNPMTQDEFADWIDDHEEDIIDVGGMPKPIELLEMARNLHIHTKGTFSKSMDRTTGQFALVSKEEHTSESTKIPKAFKTALRIFEGGAKYEVEIRLKFRMVGGRASFSFDVHRDEELKRDAFGEMRTEVQGKTERPVFAGRHD